jgi:UDP-N-acetylglucosamine--N-acetylmuramyl-(pentapeptide) pyrophosphoryl-undecaprenol N-acetylglucosamine transferase
VVKGSLRVVIAGGGTGGHLYPGLAVARELVARQSDAVITFAGTARGLEARVVPREGFELDTIRSAGLKGKSIGTRLGGLALLPASALDAWRIISRRRPHLVIGVGGYSSGPIVALAAIRGIATMVLEQNAVPGLTNRLLARVVRAAALTFEEAVPFFMGKAFVSGNPVRAEFFDKADEGGGLRDRATRVLIVGGSQGAHAINVAMVAAAPKLAAAPSLVVTHQTGERDVELVRDGYRAVALNARVEPFLFAMDREMKSADLVVCRAGATTIAELTASGKPAIFVPLPGATDDHQRKNARALEAAGAAEVADEAGLTGDALAERILALAADPERRIRMGAAARQLARPDAARVIVDRALALVGNGQGREGG